MIESLNEPIGGLAQSQFGSTGDSTSVKPSIGIHPQGLAIKLFQIAWLLNGFQKTMEACCFNRKLAWFVSVGSV